MQDVPAERVAIGTAVTSFRSGHNLTFVVLAQQSQWRVARAGEVTGASFGVWNTALQSRYSYHLNLFRKFGMVFGTGLGASIENKLSEGFYAGSSVMLPSIVVGLVQDVKNDLRVMVLAEYSAFWFPWMQASGAPKSGAKSPADRSKVYLSPVLDGGNVFLQVDKFFKKNLGIVAGVGWGIVSSNLFGPPAKNTLPALIKVKKLGPFAAVGMVTTVGE